MAPTVLPLDDQTRGRLLPTTVYIPQRETSAPLIVFCHGLWGHPRKFSRLFARWSYAWYGVPSPALPHTNDKNPPPFLIDDVVNQPGDGAFVLDELLARGRG